MRKMADFCSLPVLFFILIVSAAAATVDPELKQCKHQCTAQQQFDSKDKQSCIRDCQDYYRQKKEREGDDDHDELLESTVPLTHCRKQCERYAGSGEERQLCRFRCQKRWGTEGRPRHGEEEEGTGREADNNPYVFHEHHFETRAKTEQGRVDFLQKFTERSKLLRGIENYRIGILVANPNSFVVPNHWDADAIYFVTQGRGTISLIEQDRRESFNINKGDIITIPAGTPEYLINRDQNEKLFIIKLLNPVNLPGEFEAFSGASGENPESFFNAFSWEVLEAAFKTSRDKLERVLRKQGDGVIVKASREQIRSLSEHGETGGRVWPFGGGDESRFKFNVFSRGPSQSNSYGQLWESEAAVFRQLRDLDVGVSYANITSGSMTALNYNSRATKIAVVVRGEGHFEMACPHTDERQSSQRPSYRKIRARLRPDTVVVVPAGHPYVTVNTGKNEDLEILCFELNWEGNVRYPLVGKTNHAVKHMEREAKELAFKTSSREVDQVFGSQDSDFFLAGPRRQRESVADE